jgi:ATP-dependent DNA helicase RecQ
VVNDIVNRKFGGTTAILTRTNEEASLVNSELKSNGIKSKLILTNDNFQIKDLCEVRYFNNLILKNTDQNLGFITDQDWNYGKDKVKKHFNNSKNLELMVEIIKKFEPLYYKKLKTDWITYINEMQIENFIYPEQETIFVSTMHKAKGKEFDNVILLLDNFKATSDENNRLLYVSITRAKSQLVIHTNENIFKDFNNTKIELIKDDNQYLTPNEIMLYLSHRDIDLGFSKLDGVSKSISNLMAGDKLFLSEDKTGLLSKNKKWVVKFSASFKEKINRWVNNGYTCDEASINYIVYWIDKDDNKECKVVLPVMKMSKKYIIHEVSFQD